MSKTKKRAIKLIDMHKRIEDIKREGDEERREVRRSLNRKLLEVRMLTVGNKKDIETLYKRTSDNKEDIEQLQGYVHWVVKLIAGIIVTVIVTVILNSFMEII